MNVENYQELLTAIEKKETEIIILRSMLVPQSITIPDSITLQGQKQENGEYPMLMFNQTDGIGLTSNNTIKHLGIQTGPQFKAIYLNSLKENLGSFQFENLTLTGQFSFIMYEPSKIATVNVSDVSIISANSRAFMEQPQKYGVNVLQGALTIYNFNSDAESQIIASLANINVGMSQSPVIGSGIFLAGFGDNGGRLLVDELSTGSIYSTGNLPFGVSDLITAGVFVSTGAFVKKITQLGDTVTYGVNDMVLDAWGTVDTWEVSGKVISYGPSGVGFVNFGQVNHFTLANALETYGLGARGYNQYDGTLKSGTFQSVETFGGGAVAMQVSKSVGRITVLDDIKTHGSRGNSLVKGVNVELPAIALSIKSGGNVNSMTVGGNVETYGDGVVTYQVENDGIVNELHVSGEIRSHGKNSDNIVIFENGHSPKPKES